MQHTQIHTLNIKKLSGICSSLRCYLLNRNIRTKHRLLVLACSDPEQSCVLMANCSTLRRSNTFSLWLQEGSHTSALFMFSVQSPYNPREEFSLLATKCISWEGVLENLLWFIKASTHAKEFSSEELNISCQWIPKPFGQSGILHQRIGNQFFRRGIGMEHKEMNSAYSG